MVFTAADPYVLGVGFAAWRDVIPFARTAAERKAAGDPRLSLEERYGSHEGYVAAVSKAAARATAEKFLLPEDAKALIEAARASAVLR